jgi:hypothetical protein
LAIIHKRMEWNLATSQNYVHTMPKI